MTANTKKVKKFKWRSPPAKTVTRTGGKDTLVEQARLHGIFVLDHGHYIDFMDEFTGVRLGRWYESPCHRYLIKGVFHAGSPRDCLIAIVLPNAL